MPSAKSKNVEHAPPLIFLPKEEHKRSIIVLHGRGSTAQKFAEPLLNHNVRLPTTKSESPADTAKVSSTPKTFQSYFPDTKFIFPTAPLRRAVVFKRSLTHQWFDNWSHTEPELKQHLQVPGLRETSAFLHALLLEESALVGPENVVLMGLSQGCAASIISTLLWRGKPFGALVGMCGYLPFRTAMEDYLGNGEEEDQDSVFGSNDEGDHMFERDPEDDIEKSNMVKAVEGLREELQIDTVDDGEIGTPALMSIPVFMGHGKEDEKVPFKSGKMAAEFLQSLEINVTWKEYEALGHWYSEEMLGDVVQFLLHKHEQSKIN